MISIRTKIISIIIFCTLGFGGLIAYFTISKGMELHEKQAAMLILADTTSLANKIKSENNKTESMISTVASLMANNFQLDTALINKDYLREKVAYLTEINAELLKRSIKSNNGTMSIYATFNVEYFKEVFETWHTVQNGEVTLMEIEPLELFDNPDSPDMAWYFNPVKERKGLWTTTYEDALTKIPMYSFVEPAIDSEGNIVGVVGMDISLEGISEFVSNQKTIKNGFSFLVDKDNELIVKPRESIDQALFELLLTEKTKKPEGIVSDSQAIIAYNLLPNNQIVATYVKRSDVLNDIYSLRIDLVLFAIIMTFVSAILGLVLVVPIISRINMLRGAAAIDANEKIIESISNNLVQDEISQLANAFSMMLKRIKSSQTDLEKNNRTLEKRVKERTVELEGKLEELEKFRSVTINRELKMVELKKKLKKLSNNESP